MVTATLRTPRSLEGALHDVVVVGGGPAGLAAAIVAAELGASVLVVEQRALPPDKACGEGLLPPAVRALERLGVLDEIPAAERRAFAGIRFVQEDGTSAALPLPSGGLVVIHDAFINAEKTGPLHIAEYSALLMNITEGKCYSVREMQGYLADAGFDWLDFQPTAVGRSFILARKI